MKEKLKKIVKDKSIKKQLAFMIIGMVVSLCLLLGSITIYLNYKTANQILLDTVKETAKQASENIGSKIRNIQNTAVQTGCIKRISDPKITVEEKKALIDNQVKLYGFQRGNVLDVNGKSYFNGEDYSNREYFKRAMQGNAYISEPLIGKADGKTTFVISAPVWENGVRGSKIVGVVFFVPNENFLNDIIKDIEISPNSHGYIINKEGTTVAYEDPSVVGVENTIKESETDPQLKDAAEVDRKILSGETGSGEVNLKGTGWVVGYSGIEGTDGWGMGIMADRTEFLQGLYASITIVAILSILFIIIGFIVAIGFSKKIGNPLSDCSERLEKLAEGDLHSDIPTINSENEIGLLANATEKIVTDLTDVIETIKYVLAEISEGNLNIDIEDKKYLFKDDFEPILLSIDGIVESLNSTLSQINTTSEQVAIGSYQVSEGAQILSQGATEQASSVEELVSIIGEVSSQAQRNVENTTKAELISKEAAKATEKGQNQMNEMVLAMDDISSASNEIGKIIKNIDDIAFQTNILALNAAVEAARAGEAGKGFAVVAEEVRNLASKSAESAKTTEVLIEKSLKAIDNGIKIVSETAKSLDEIVSGSEKSATVLAHIAQASNSQAQAIEQANIGVEQISVVVQTNSATAEESAAASEELSSQAEVLKGLIGKFRLKEDETNSFGNENEKLSFIDNY